MARMEDLPTTRSEDELLQEYLHLINAKDQRVHELLKELEDCQCAAAKREADLRDQAVAAEEALAEAQTHMKDLQRKAKDDDRTIHIMAQANERLQNEVLQVRVQLAQRKLLAQEAEQRWTMEVCELQGRHKHGFITTRRLVEDHNRLSRKLAEVEARAASLSNTADELQKHLHQAELRNTEEVGRATALENKLEQMVPRVESEAAIRTVEESLAEHMRIHERTKERLELNLATTREKLELADASLVKAQREVEDRTTKLQKMSEEYAAHQQQATLSRQAAQRREEALQKEVEQMQKEHRVAVDRAAESERHAASLSEQLKLSASNLHTLAVQHERIKVEKDQLDQAHRELLRQSQDASSHARAEMERLQHEAKAKDGAVAKSADELATLRERSARDIGELKEKLSAMATAETSRNAELHRLELDVKRTQQQLDEAASRHQRQLAEMAAKVDEEMHLRQRTQQQLQSAEEGHRRLELTARGELEALQHKHAELLQDVRHGKQTEAAEAAQRLDQCREELALTRGGRTGVQQELEATGGSFRHALEENGRLRNRVALSDEQVAAQQREVGSLKAAAQAHEAHEAQLKAQLDQLRSSLCEREGSVAELQRALQQAKEDAQRGEAQRERTHLQTVSELQRRVEQCQSVADAQRGRAADVEASLRELQHAHRTLEHQRDVLAEKHQRASEYIAAGKADIAHLRTLLETKDVELVRVTAHAGEVEDLAKRTREELQRTFTARDAQVSAAKADIARLLRELAEERRQAAQAQGRCQQLAEEQRATQTLAEETQRRHRASEEELARLRAQTMSAEEQMRELDGILKVRDQQLRLAEEEVVRVRGQLERRGEEMAEVKAHAEAEASSLREKAQRDRARLKEAASSSPHHHRRGSTAERLERSGASAATSSSPCDRCRRMERRLTTSIADQLSDFVDEALWCKSNLHRIALTAHANAIYSMKAAGATAAASKRRVRVAAFTPPPHPRGRLGRAEAGRDDDDDDDDDVRQGGPSSSPVVGEDTETLALHLRRTKMDLAKLREEAAHHATQAAQLRSQLLEAENRSAASRAELQQERQALRQQQERTSRQLNDRLAEHRHNEDELRDLRAELAAAQRRMTEQAAQLQEYKVRQRLEAERVERSTEGRTAAAAEVAQLRAEAQECREQLRRAKTGHQADVQAARERQRSIEAQQDALRSSLSSCEADKRRLEKQVQSLTVERDALREELSDIRQCDGQHATQLHITKAELSALKERLANVESLKAISDNALLQVQTREQELLRRIEELRGDQQLLQLCFNRQQQQLLQSRRGSGVAEE